MSGKKLEDKSRPGADLIVRLLSSGIASGLAETATLPLDMAKVRLQVQVASATPVGGGVAAAAAPRYSGLFDVLYQVGSKEGPKGLWSGLAPALLRQVSYSSLTFMLFEPLLETVSRGKKPEDITFIERLLSSGTAGAISITIMNPTEVLKTRLQVPVRGRRPDLEETLRQIHQTSGVRGFWAGVGPNVARTFLVNAAELGTYSQIKAFLKAQGVPEGVPMVASSSFLAGLASAVVSTPADVIKTRLMDQAGNAASGGGVRYTSIAHALLDPKESIWAREGPAALYKGFGPIVVRKVAWCTVFFLCYEDLKAKLYGLN